MCHSSFNSNLYEDYGNMIHFAEKVWTKMSIDSVCALFSQPCFVQRIPNEFKKRSYLLKKIFYQTFPAK